MKFSILSQDQKLITEITNQAPMDWNLRPFSLLELDRELSNLIIIDLRCESENFQSRRFAQRKQSAMHRLVGIIEENKLSNLCREQLREFDSVITWPLPQGEVKKEFDLCQDIFEIFCKLRAEGMELGFDRACLTQVALQKQRQTNVLIQGETGTGKEILAKLFRGSNKPFIAINSVNISDALFESELFGHKKGSFTGALQYSTGLVAAAHGGDLFIDEIQNLSSAAQAKLLRFIETGEYKSVGDINIKHAKVRIIAATNRDLKELASQGQFREDLYYRLAIGTFELSPLRDRAELIPILAQRFLRQCRSHSPKMFSDDALKTLQDHSWPGNFRELKHLCLRLDMVCPLPVISRLDVEQFAKLKSKEFNSQTENGVVGLYKALRNFESNFIRRTMLECELDIEKTCEVLQVSRSTLYKRIKEFRLEDETWPKQLGILKFIDRRL